MLVHHPSYLIAGIEDGPANAEDYTVIDDKFVKTYYAGGENNSKLKRQLAKKENVFVLFPNPVELIQSFVAAQQKFAELIAENKIIRDALTDEATIKWQSDSAD